MALGKVNFTLVTPYVDVEVRDFPIDAAGTNMPADLNPNDANVIRDGEWLTLNKYKVKRGSATADFASRVQAPTWVAYGEKGRTDLQGVGKMPVIWRGTYEADTNLFATATVDTDLLGGSSITVGMPLIVGMGIESAGGYSKFNLLYGLKGNATPVLAKSGFVVGYCTRPASENGGRGIRIYCHAGGHGFQMSAMA